MSALGTVTTCPDGQRTSTAGDGITVTGTNAGDAAGVGVPRRRSSRRQ